MNNTLPKNKVVNCFQICIFVSSNTTQEGEARHSYNVVNCFQICIFVSSNTTQHVANVHQKKL